MEDPILREINPDPLTQTFSDLQKVVNDLQEKGNKVFIFADSNITTSKQRRNPSHEYVDTVTPNGHYIDKNVDGSLKTFLLNTGLTDVLTYFHEIG